MASGILTARAAVKSSQGLTVFSDPVTVTITAVPVIIPGSAINGAISSIAMENLALSHILNAEGEKLQYVLGTLPGLSGESPTVEQVLRINDSVRQMLQTSVSMEYFLGMRLSDVLKIRA